MDQLLEFWVTMVQVPQICSLLSLEMGPERQWQYLPAIPKVMDQALQEVNTK